MKPLLHTSTLLPSGRALVRGGGNASGVLNSPQLYLYDLGINDSRRPVIASVNSPITPGQQHHADRHRL